MPTKVEKAIMNDGNKLTKALEVLMYDIIYASIFNKLIYDIIEYRNKNSEIFHQSNTFWYLSLGSLNESRMIRLCRICDTETNSISINNLLKAIKGCNNLFSKEEFQKRLKDNPFVDSLSEHNRKIDIKELDNEIKLFDSSITVGKIRKWRNNYVAHKGIMEGLLDFKILHENQLSHEEISIFIDYSHRLIDKYFHTLNAVSWSDKIVGGDDFMSLMKFASIGLEKYKKDIELEIENVRCSP